MFNLNKMDSKEDETEKPFIKPGRKICPDHQEEDLRFFCLSCEVPICRDCKVVTHDGHKADLVANVAKGMRKKLVNLLEKTELEISKLKDESEDTSEKADIKEEMVPNDEDTMNEIRNIANETKAEIDKLVSEIESEIKLHDEEPNAERLRVKMANLVALKKSLVEALDSDYETVKAFKDLVEDSKCSEEMPEDSALTRSVVKENLLSDFRVFFGEINVDIRNFNVKGVASGQLYTEKYDGSQHIDSVGLGFAQWFRSTTKKVSGLRFQSLRHIAARLSADRCFWVLQMVFCSLPILQSIPLHMLLLNAYPDVQPVVSMIVPGVCFSSGLLMLSGNSKLKYGAVLFAGILAYFAFNPYLRNDGIGPRLVLSRHTGCIGLYFIFAGRKASSKAMEAVGGFCTFVYVISSIPILWDGRVQILFPGGKLSYIAASVLFTLLIMYFLKEKSFAFAVASSIILASSLIVVNNDLIDPEWRKTAVDLDKWERSLAQGYSLNQAGLNKLQDFKTFLNRIYWTVMRLVVCNVNTVVGISVVMEREVTAICKRIFQFVQTRLMSMDDHRN